MVSRPIASHQCVLCLIPELDGLSVLLAHDFSSLLRAPHGEGGEGVLLSIRLMGMGRWIGSSFHDWIDYKGVAFSVELLEWDRIFSGFGGNNILESRDLGC